MKLPRRDFLRLLGSAAALPAVARIARADTYPSRPVHIIVGYAPGGPTDIVARLMGQWLSERLGQQFVIENRPGAGSNIGAETVVKANPDGYTLFEITISNAINASLYSNLNFDVVHDLAPVAGHVRTPGVMEVTQAFPAKTLPEFIAYAKANPGKVNMATAGSGSGPDIYGALFKMMAGVDLVPIAYRGSGPAKIDLISGQVQVLFDPLASSIELIKANKVRPLAVTTATRLDVLPDVPAIADSVPGYDATTWNGFVAPRNTPSEIIDKLNREINAALADPKMKAKIAEFSGIPLSGSPSDFARLIADETEKLAKVVKFAGMRPE